MQLRGVIDRLELDEHGDLVVTDYKTGSVPSEFWEAKSLSGVHIYALLCERMLGKHPGAGAANLPVQARADHRHSHRSVDPRRRTQDIGPAGARSRTTYERDDFHFHPGRLCDWCFVQAVCPAYGGNPIDAAELRGPGTVIAPTLPLVDTPS